MLNSTVPVSSKTSMGEDLAVGMHVRFELRAYALEIGKLDAEVDLRLDALAKVAQLELEPRVEEVGERAFEHVRAQHGHQGDPGCQDGRQAQS